MRRRVMAQGDGAGRGWWGQEDACRVEGNRRQGGLVVVAEGMGERKGVGGRYRW